MILKGQTTIEGAGVRLHRVFGNAEIPKFDPFLLLDDFSSNNPDDYLAGFPWHPHRGIETVTYMISGRVEHGDNIGNEGIIKSGEVQWMTAGSGIIHQEMPQKCEELKGFQLWVNLPKEHKMMRPRYQGIIEKMIPIVKKDGVIVRVIAGEFCNVKGPVKDVMAGLFYLDVTVDGNFSLDLDKKNTSFVYVFEGSVDIDGRTVKKGELMKVSELRVKGAARFIFVSGRPLNEPIAWGGPIVMNTREELKKAFEELDDGTFIK